MQLNDAARTLNMMEELHQNHASSISHH